MLDRGAREIDGVSGRRYTARDGVFDVHPADADALVQLGGAKCSTSGVARSRGYECRACGFRTYFKTCGRCGGRTERE